MDAQTMKEYIFNNDKVEYVLEQLEMHHIQWHSNRSYITCGMPDGDNPSSTVVYCDSSFLNVKAYTRDIEDAYGVSDILSLISFVKQTIFSQTIKWLCDLFGLDYYSQPKEKDSAVDYMDFLNSIKKLNTVEEPPLKPISEQYLKSYLNWDNIPFYEDNISYETQTEFELGVDVSSHRITIPIRDEIGNLVGVKGRRVYDVVDEYNPKYIYLHKCAKSRVLYGLYKTLPYIKENNSIIVCESEKGVMQLWSYGYRNAVAVGGHDISPRQKDLIVQSGAATVIIAFDKDVDEEIIKKQAEKLSAFRKVEYIYDIDNLLKEKESPMDDPSNWVKLYYNYRRIYV